MARTFYGGSPADVIAKVTLDDGDLAPDATASLTAWDAATGGTQITDLLNVNSSPVTVVTADNIGRVRFYGPDGYAGSIWLQDGDGNRWRIDPSDLANRLTEGGSVAPTWDEVTGKPSTFTPSSHQHPAADISDSTATGRSVLSAANQAAARTAIDAASSTHTHTAAQISDATATGRAVLSAASQAAARTAIGAASTTDIPNLSTQSVKALQDWSDATPADANTPQWDALAGAYAPVDLTTQFAQIDSGTGRLQESNNPNWFVPIIVLAEGQGTPPGFPIGGIRFIDAGSASVIPTALQPDGAAANTGAAVANDDLVPYPIPEDIKVGEKFAVIIGNSGEAGTGFPATHTVTFSAGAATITQVVSAQQTGSAQVRIVLGECTTLIPSTATINVNALGTGAVANDRQHMHVAVVRLPGLTSTPVDQTAIGNANGSSTLTIQTGQTGTLAQAKEVAILAAYQNTGGSSADRDLTGTGGWAGSSLYNFEQLVGATGRRLWVGARVLDSTSPVQGTFSVTATDSNTGAWAAALATFRVA